MWKTIAILIISLLCIIKVLKALNRNYFILSLCKRFKTIDGSSLDTKLVMVPGQTRFGNNFDVLNKTPETTFEFLRDCVRQTKGRSFGFYFLFAPVYNIVTAEDAEQILQSQALITKSVIYEIIREFLGLGLLISTDEIWQFRRKILTPAFHFNILLNFLEIFKDETYRFVEHVKEQNNEVFQLNEIIPEFTLNNICETALGVKLNDVAGSSKYRKAVNDMEPIIVHRLCNPLMYYPIIFRYFGDYKANKRLLDICHEFSSRIVQKKREEYRNNKKNSRNIEEKSDDYGKKKRYAMLDTLLDAEQQGLIDHQGICDEVNTFMFEGYDTTSVCLMFSLLNLAAKPDIQEKCYNEIKDLAEMSELTVFDFNKLEYLECVIKETLRLYPSVPFIARQAMTETTLNGLIIPKNTQINVHIFDIMRDPKHFPDPERFDPDRFLPHNTTNRHPFAFIPFSAGPRNCIGQKFAMLEIKVLLVSILKNFKLLPVTRPEDIIFENGIVLRSKHPIKVKIVSRG